MISIGMAISLRRLAGIRNYLMIIIIAHWLAYHDAIARIGYVDALSPSARLIARVYIYTLGGRDARFAAE